MPESIDRQHFERFCLRSGQSFETLTYKSPFTMVVPYSVEFRIEFLTFNATPRTIDLYLAGYARNGGFLRPKDFKFTPHLNHAPSRMVTLFSESLDHLPTSRAMSKVIGNVKKIYDGEPLLGEELITLEVSRK